MPLRPVGCDGVEINVPWPPPEQIDHFRQYSDCSHVVLQIGPKMLEGPYKLEVVAELVADREYRWLITDVLIDISGGTGKEIGLPFARRMVECLRAWNQDLGIGIAGGLCAETLPVFADIVREHGLSIDAEGKLRNERDELDLDKVRAYLDSAARIWGWR